MEKKITKYTLLVFFTALLFPIIAQSQITTDSIKPKFDIFNRLIESSDNGSEIIINQDSRVESLLKQHFDKGHSGKNLKGWRIRIFRDNSRDNRNRSVAVEASFRNNYPGIPVYRTYVAPNFYVSVGDFRSRDEAEKMKKELRNTYPGASIIEVIINFPPL